MGDAPHRQTTLAPPIAQKGRDYWHGRGGDVILLGDVNTNNLVDYKYQPHWNAGRGGHGEGSDCNGREGENRELRMPLGTVVIDTATEKPVAEVLEDGQRIVLCRGGNIIVLDEPTTGLDVSTQSHVLATVRDLCRSHGVAALYVTHDLAVVANLADHVAVMYAGQIVERAPVASLFARPEHPYTVGLLGSIPKLDEKRARLPSIEGRVPGMTRPHEGCRFAARCPFALGHRNVFTLLLRGTSLTASDQFAVVT